MWECGIITKFPLDDLKIGCHLSECCIGTAAGTKASIVLNGHSRGHPFVSNPEVFITVDMDKKNVQMKTIEGHVYFTTPLLPIPEEATWAQVAFTLYRGGGVKILPKSK